MTRGIMHTPSHTNVFFLVLVFVFNFNLFEFPATILKKGLFWENLQISLVV